MGAISSCARQLNCFRHQSYSLSLARHWNMGFYLVLCQSALLKPHLPLCLRSRVIGMAFCARTRTCSNVVIRRHLSRSLFYSQHVGTAYLHLRANLVNHEITFAWVCGQTNTAVGYVQLTHLVNDQEQLHVLITGLGVEEAFRRRGFGRAMLLHVIASVPAKEIWVEVQEDNRPAMKLYIECGYVVRRKQETLTRRITFPWLP
ncbi:hypothetical protein EDC04DRAFT_1749830 [Pisolithus marmoratus]|nr:hypothetical protein EDC04DRAFT_1749830 [Pisolithus marmoratus]